MSVLESLLGLNGLSRYKATPCSDAYQVERIKTIIRTWINSKCLDLKKRIVEVNAKLLEIQRLLEANNNNLDLAYQENSVLAEL